MTHLQLSEFTQRERIPTEIFSGSADAARRLAREIGDLIEERRQEGKRAVLGLATGSTPVGLYRELVRLHREEGLSFKGVVTFNLDEYFGLSPEHPESYRRFMRDQLFDHIDIDPSDTHVPDGTVDRDEVFESCRAYEERIAAAGGIDLQILGIGRTGHIGFNEPGSGPETRTRLVTLDHLTRRDAARDFLGEENVPRFAITMGVGTILDARKVVLLAWGEGKAEVIRRAVEEPPTDSIPAGFLQNHPYCRFLLDAGAASRLTRVRHPWLVGPVAWDEALTRKAVLWLSSRVEKPLLKLVDEDYSENGMADLLTERGSAYQLNIRIFNVTQHTITGWPGGKPNADDSNRPERASPHPKRALVLSPEPMDDVFSMGGTLHRLANQGHELTIAYQTSGSLAVPDSDLRRAVDLILKLGEQTGAEADTVFARKVEDQLEEKGEFGSDTADIRRIKALIRQGEALSSARSLGLDESCVRFLELPFYERGRYRRFSPGEEDVAAVAALLDEVRPHQIFATGFDQDPLSVPSLCFQVLREALASRRDADWFPGCRIWLYKGLAAEWEAHEIDMAVPLSPAELENKINGIYQHLTQRSQRPSSSRQGSRETWALAESLNRHNASVYDALGLAEYEAIEGFRLWSLNT